MIKRLTAAALAIVLAGTPSFVAAEEAAADAAPAAAPRIFMPVNFNAQEDLDNLLYLDLSNGKRVTIRLMPSWAPEHIERIKTLTRQGFYDGIIFHRVIDGFMAQTGDPTGTGQGGSELPDLKQEFNPMPHVRGTVSMARAQGEDSANSQFFIVFYPRLGLDRKYTNFGRVIAGMDAVDEIQRGEPPANPTRIVQASIGSDRKAPPVIAQPAQEQLITADMLNAAAGSEEAQ
ncbi:peptidylprolyl isomerase [Erythrobacter sp. SG61-1L]|uniref:peptidylprolyl isomerase n=1 Tax=Erythrobacter sp. SG61-1L TaxID=1603897 RepID=UPI0006C9297E|nr:peptidylprolyl isomerase [Erythrobacter sp. SG61-1L]KPL67728.1 peptidylprolyl isomerase [Erythrobacter sp. SG61-1L]